MQKVMELALAASGRERANCAFDCVRGCYGGVYEDEDDQATSE